MVIQHNLLAANADRQFTRINDKKAKFTEKLSSGYRINRAADDAAGLSISEKLRAQIRGLDQASSNAQDGLSLIQTADGALNEVHSMLQRIRELSVSGANDTNISTDRKAIQEEINSLTKEIDSIAKNTEFNQKKLLDGSCSKSGLAKSEKDKFSSWLNGSWLTDATSKIFDATGWKLEPGTNLSVAFEKIGANAVATMSGSYLGNDLTLTVNTLYLTDGLTYNGTDGPTIGGMSADRVITHEMTHALMFNNVSSTAAPDNWFIEGLAEAVHGASDIRYSGYELYHYNNFKDVNDGIQNFDFANDQSGYDTYTVGYLAVSYLDHKITEVDPSKNIKDMLGEMNQSDESFRDLITKYTGQSFTGFVSEFKNDAKSAYDAGTFNDFLKSECGVDLTDGKADPLDGNDNTNSAVVPNIGATATPASTTTTLNLEGNTVNLLWDSKIGNSGITLQIGANSEQSITVSIESVTATTLGIDNLSVSNHNSAENSITLCETAIDFVSNLRSNLGAYQNRLEHIISNLDNTSENTQYAESRIRDVDMAGAMVEFSKSDILSQAGQAMITQANQNPQGILSLLQ